VTAGYVTRPPRLPRALQQRPARPTGIRLFGGRRAASGRTARGAGGPASYPRGPWSQRVFESTRRPRLKRGYAVERPPVSLALPATAAEARIRPPAGLYCPPAARRRPYASPLRHGAYADARMTPTPRHMRRPHQYKADACGAQHTHGARTSTRAPPIHSVTLHPPPLPPTPPSHIACTRPPAGSLRTRSPSPCNLTDELTPRSPHSVGARRPAGGPAGGRAATRTEPAGVELVCACLSRWAGTRASMAR
jgi:hypothetical protein